MSTFKKYMSIIQEGETKDETKFTINNSAASVVTDENKDAAIEKLTKAFNVGIKGKAIQLEYKKTKFAIAKKDNTFYVLDPDFDEEKSKSLKNAFDNAKDALDAAIKGINGTGLDFSFTGLSLGDGEYAQVSSEPLMNDVKAEAFLKNLKKDEKFTQKLKELAPVNFKQKPPEDEYFSKKVSEIFRVFNSIQGWEKENIGTIMKLFNRLFNVKELLTMSAYYTMIDERTFIDIYNANCKTSKTSPHSLMK